MTTIIVLILVYAILGKDVKALLAKVKNVDWKSRAGDVYAWLKPYALKAGRAAAKPLVTFFYVMNDESTSLLDRVLVYAALLYILSPVSLVPATVYHFLGILDESAAGIFVYKKIKDHISAEIQQKVENTLDEWFGTNYADYEIVQGGEA